MKETRAYSPVHVLGEGWYGQKIAMGLEMDGFAIVTYRNPNGFVDRDCVSDWLETHAGDFSLIIDFWASLEVDGVTVEISWADEESECAWNDAMFGDES